MTSKKRRFLDLESAQYRWPRKGDRLLRDASDWNRGVEFSRDGTSRHVHIWEGYMSAGAALVAACEQDSNDRHFLVYPILFNYRHGLELAMKWVIAHYGPHSTFKIPDTEHHNLWQLWKLCKKIIIELGSEDEALPVVEQVVKDFHDLDASALSFRYSRDKNGAVIALPDRSIDLANICGVMEAVSHFFDGVDGELDHNVSSAP